MLVLQLDIVRKKVAEISGRDEKEVRVVACPYRICPLGAHIDHQVKFPTKVFFNINSKAYSEVIVAYHFPQITLS